MDTRFLEQLVREVIRQVGEKETARQAGSSGGGIDPRRDYPIAEKRPDLIRTATGKKLDDVTLEAVLEGRVTAQDVTITPDALLIQAEVAEACGRRQLAENFRRAAELTKIPDERLLQIYNALRPYRSTKQELLDIAEELEAKYGAKKNAAFVREAAQVYERRGRLRAG